MGLQASEGNGGKGFANNTLFVNTGRIVRCIDHGPGAPCDKLPDMKRYEKFDKESDMIVEIVLDIDRDFQPSIVVMGRLEKDDKGSFKGIGPAGDMVSLARAVNFIKQDILDDDGRLTTAFIEAVTDETVQYLRYYTGTSDEGKDYYDNWTRLYADDVDPNDMVDAFLLSYAKYGWPKNYVQQKMETAGFQDEGSAGDGGTTDTDDDLPW